LKIYHKGTEECFALKFEIRNPKQETNGEIEELMNWGIEEFKNDTILEIAIILFLNSKIPQSLNS